VAVLVMLARQWRGVREPYRDERKIIRAGFGPMTLYVLSVTLLFNVDKLFVRNFLTSDSGGYGAVITLGAIPALMINPVIMVILPLAAAEHVTGGALYRYLRQAVHLGLAVTAVCLVLLVAAGGPLLRLWNPAFQPYAGLLGLYALTMGLDALIQIIANVQLARHAYRPLWFVGGATLLMCAALYAAREILTLNTVVAIMFATRCAIVLGLAFSSGRAPPKTGNGGPDPGEMAGRR
jgi:hypothetical protein